MTIPELRLLGGAVLLDATGAPVAGAAAQPRRIAVLAVLAEAWPSTVTRDRMVGLLWADHDEPAARRLLSQALYALRREIGNAIVASGRDLALDPAALRCDLVAFRRHLAADEAEAAVALHRGPALDGFHLRDALEFERWTDALRDDVRRRHAAALESLVARCAAEGRPREAARWGERLAEAAPFDAPAAAALVALWDRAGDRGAALAAAEAYERRVRDELGMEPDPAVRRAADRLRATTPTAPIDAAPDSQDTITIAAALTSVLASVTGQAAPRPADAPVAGARRTEPAFRPPPGLADLPTRPPIPTPRRSRPIVPVDAPRRGLLRHTMAWTMLVPAAGLAMAGLVAAGPSAQPSIGRDEPRVVALLPVEVRGDSGGALPLDSALAGMLVGALDGAGGARIERVPRRPRAGARPAEWARLHAVAVVAGGRVRVDAELRPARGHLPPTRVSVEGARDSVIAVADRLALALLPALYPAVPAAAHRPHGLGRAAAVRHYLDADAALRRGEFGRGHDALRRATEADPGSAIAWYRRSIAAELAHRGADADRAIAEAERRAAGLPAADRRLVRAQARWRAGDALGADSLLRAAVRDDASDPDAWFGLAEVAYHAGPLHGRALDLARDPWRQLVALDSASYPALMHLVRLEARAGDTAAVRRLLRRVEAVGATGPAAVESRVVAAYATGRDADTAAVSTTLDSLPHYSLGFLQGVVAGMLERPDLAVGIARRLVEPSRPAAVRANGHLALARLHVAAGRWRDAMAEIDRAAPLDPAAAAWTRAQLVTLPFVSADPGDVARARAALQGAASAPGAAPLTLQLAAEEPAAATIASYLAASLDLAGMRGADAPTTLAGCGAEAPADVRALCADLRAGLRAEALRRAGDAAGALVALESVTSVVPYQLAARSVFLARTRERWLRAALLEGAARDAEAERWYAAVPHGSWADHPYLAATHLRRGAIRERAGDHAAAAAHYRRVVLLLPRPDAELAALRRDAEAGLRRTAQPR